jgi:hypothetical protein
MRKIVAMLTAVAALAAVGAQTAAADAPSTVETEYIGDAIWTTCTTEWQYGAYGAYGAWGDYIDGCTVTFECPWRYCHIYGRSSIATQELTGNRVTLNQRIRSPYAFVDASCAGRDACAAEAYVAGLCPACSRISDFIRYGETASVQCNGVRDEDIPDSEQTLGQVVCGIRGDPA